MLTGFNHLTLAVADLPRSLAFYTALPGMRLKARWDGGAYLALGELWLCLSLDPRRVGHATADYTHFAFTAAPGEFDALAQQLRSSGVPEWKSNVSEGDSFYCLDPDGHRLEIHVGDLASRLAQCRQRPYAVMVFFD